MITVSKYYIIKIGHEVRDIYIFIAIYNIDNIYSCQVIAKIKDMTARVN